MDTASLLILFIVILIIPSIFLTVWILRVTDRRKEKKRSRKKSEEHLKDFIANLGLPQLDSSESASLPSAFLVVVPQENELRIYTLSRSEEGGYSMKCSEHLQIDIGSNTFSRIGGGDHRKRKEIKKHSLTKLSLYLQGRLVGMPVFTSTFPP